MEGGQFHCFEDFVCLLGALSSNSFEDIFASAKAKEDDAEEGNAILKDSEKYFFAFDIDFIKFSTSFAWIKTTYLRHASKVTRVSSGQSYRAL